jgi:hypothetical protein
MALTACPGCAKEFSDEADTCPRCGHAMTDRRNAIPDNTASTKTMPPDEPITTQPTGREWKIVRLIGGLLMVTGVLAWAGNSTDAGMVFFLGCLIYLGGRFGDWWMRRT